MRNSQAAIFLVLHRRANCHFITLVCVALAEVCRRVAALIQLSTADKRQQQKICIVASLRARVLRTPPLFCSLVRVVSQPTAARALRARALCAICLSFQTARVHATPSTMSMRTRARRHVGRVSGGRCAFESLPPPLHGDRKRAACRTTRATSRRRAQFCFSSARAQFIAALRKPGSEHTFFFDSSARFLNLSAATASIACARVLTARSQA